MNQGSNRQSFNTELNLNRGGPGVGGRLRRLRHNADLSMRSVASAALVSQSRLSRIERDLVVPTIGDVAALCGVIGVSERTKRQLLRQIDQERITMTLGNTKAVPTFRVSWPLGRLESESKRFVSVDWRFVPGLLQTPEYAEMALEQCMRRLPDAQRSRAIKTAFESRLKRQEMLDDLSRKFSFRIHVSTLTNKNIEQHVLSDQLRWLCVQMDRPNVNIELIDGPTMEESAVAPVSALLLSSCLAIESKQRTAIFSSNDMEYSDFVSYFNEPSSDLVASGSRAQDFVATLAC